jgi:hypothetical protein
MDPEIGQTGPFDIPPAHVLEAAQNQERKETEDLLAGCDARPTANRGGDRDNHSCDGDEPTALGRRSGACDCGAQLDDRPHRAGAAPMEQHDRVGLGRDRAAVAAGDPARTSWSAPPDGQGFGDDSDHRSQAARFR